MATVSDSLGGITNLTSYIQMVGASSFSMQDFENQWDIARSSIDKEILFLNLMAPKLASLNYNMTETGNILTDQTNDVKQTDLIDQI